MAQIFLISMSLYIELDCGCDRHEMFRGDLSHQGPLRALSAQPARLRAAGMLGASTMWREKTNGEGGGEQSIQY